MMRPCLPEICVRITAALTMAMSLIGCAVPGPRSEATAAATAAPTEPNPVPPLPMIAFDSPREVPFEGLDNRVLELMRRAEVPSLAVAVIRRGRVVYRQAYGLAVPRSDVRVERPLRTDTVMYGASLTKAAFAYLVMQLVDAGLIDLDLTLPQLLPRPLPSYPAFADLEQDPRWRQVTLRQLLSHSSGLLNWRFINVGNRLDFKFDPGTRYVYSGEGIQIAQLVIEERLGQSLNALMQERVFARFGMGDTSLVWQDRFRERVSVGVALDGSLRPQRMASRPRAAGSMVTTLDDYAAFLAGVLRGEGLSAAAHRQMLSPQVAIVSPRQFPSHFPGQTDVNAPIELSAGLGWIVYRGPQGRVFFKEGNDEGTNNFAFGQADTGDGLLLLANSSRADAIFHPLVEMLFGPSCLPWFWMGYVPYDRPQWRSAAARDTPQGPDSACLAALSPSAQRSP
jgi:CubicO group peptidase (beta-lactamase class C family)